MTDQQVAGLNSMSAEDRLKVIRNRVLSTLPQIYKTKGTEEAVRLIMACYGIPSVLLSVREYGGVVYDDPKASYTSTSVFTCVNGILRPDTTRMI